MREKLTVPVTNVRRILVLRASAMGDVVHTLPALSALRAVFPDAEIDWLDGVTVQYPDWWCNVRPSNTEPLLRLNLEATDGAAFEPACEKVFALLGTPVDH